MPISNNIAKSNRIKNSGSPLPDPKSHAVTLSILLSKLEYSDKKYRPGLITTAMFLWITGRWHDPHTTDTIPNLVRIASTKPCQENSIRTVKFGNSVWIEYAVAYPKGLDVVYLWQPLPLHLNRLLQPIISKCPYEEPILNKNGKAILLNILTTAWKTPDSLKSLERVNKNTFFSYLSICAQRDNTLTAIVRSVLLPIHMRGHESAANYQRLDSEQIRYNIFSAQNRYLERIINAARKADLHRRYASHANQISLNLIMEAPKSPKYLSYSGRIVQYIMDEELKALTPEPSIDIGSVRFINENDVCQLFNRIHTHVEEMRPSEPIPDKLDIAEHSNWLKYFNAATCRLALIALVLTGLRPTHAISIEWRYFSGEDLTFVKDKGRLRSILLCQYLLGEITRYLVLQTKIQLRLPRPNISDVLWYCIDETGQIYSLSNSQLKNFMQMFWPEVIPYQLRHFFSQCLITSYSSNASLRLLDHNVDRLMSHSNFGEHLGSDQIFPATVDRMRAYLNSLPNRLGLQEMHYA